MQLAWAQERFSSQGKHDNFQDVCLIPRPYQKPHLSLRYAATTRETFSARNSWGYPFLRLWEGFPFQTSGSFGGELR